MAQCAPICAYLRGFFYRGIYVDSINAFLHCLYHRLDSLSGFNIQIFN